MSEGPAATLDDTLAERGSRYGAFHGHAGIAMGIKSVMRKGVSWSKMTPAQQEALDMIAHKIGRIANGDPTYDDSWVDIAGYAQLIVKQLRGGNP